MENDHLLEVKHLHKQLGQFSLKDISFNIEPGYITGLIGRNGTGKSSLIKTILNLYEKDSGTIFVDGHSMDEEENLAKNAIGVVLDECIFEENLSVEDNGRTFGIFYTKYDHELFLKFCERFQIQPRRKIKKLSKGQKTRFQLAFALSHGAKLFLMDEPSAGLDPLFRQELMSYMQDIVEDGTRSVLFSTHLTADLDKIGDYILVMEDGALLFCEDKESLFERFCIVHGTKEELLALPDDMVIYRDLGEYKNLAMVDKTKGICSSLPSHIPSLEEFLYYLQKGGVIK